MSSKRSEGEESEYPFVEGDGSSSDEWGDYGVAGDDYEGPPVFDDDQYGKKIDVDIDIEDVIEENSVARVQRTPSTEARNKILEEMMNNLPESCHELSLKDIVQDDLGNLTPLVEQETSVLKTGTGFKSKKLIDRKRPISRSVSLDTGVFMLKMFIPSSFSKKKSKSSPRMYSNNNSFSNNNINGSNCKSDKKCMSTNTKSRSAELAPGCWFINKPWKTNTGVSRGSKQSSATMVTDTKKSFSSKPTSQIGCIF
ncbi:hypothetical protein Tco_0938994 [Tanacetum coccineum]|uniref:Uncharacterized protein n=1 Tax=Tanacetum coccineum TaxID=301880 RepID=A0ABQ5DQQ9_9ASTR